MRLSLRGWWQDSPPRAYYIDLFCISLRRYRHKPMRVRGIYLRFPSVMHLNTSKTLNSLEWALSLTSPDAVDGDILQICGAKRGAAYTSMTIQFDSTGRLLSYNDRPDEITPPIANIHWSSTSSALVSWGPDRTGKFFPLPRTRHSRSSIFRKRTGSSTSRTCSRAFTTPISLSSRL